MHKPLKGKQKFDLEFLTEGSFDSFYYIIHHAPLQKFHDETTMDSRDFK